MIFGRKKSETQASQPVEAVPPAPPTEPPALADKMEHIDTPQSAPRVEPAAIPPVVAEASSPPPPPEPAQAAPPEDDPERNAAITEARARLQETFGKIVLAAMSEPRYRNLAINDLTALFLDPLLLNRVAIASPANEDGAPIIDPTTAIAVWASVSPEVDAKVREQIDAGTYPVRLQRDDWNSGDIYWLLDIISPSQRLTASVIANFRQILPEDGEMRIHPMVTRTMDKEVLAKLGARRIGDTDEMSAEQNIERQI